MRSSSLRVISLSQNGTISSLLNVGMIIPITHVKSSEHHNILKSRQKDKKMQQNLLPLTVPTTNPREFLMRVNVDRELRMCLSDVQLRGLAQKKKKKKVNKRFCPCNPRADQVLIMAKQTNVVLVINVRVSSTPCHCFT